MLDFLRLFVPLSPSPKIEAQEGALDAMTEEAKQLAARLEKTKEELLEKANGAFYKFQQLKDKSNET